MGDVAMAAPVLKSMSENYPDVKIIMLTRDFYAPFFDGIDNVDIHNIELSKQHQGIIGTGKLYNELCSLYNFDAIIDLNDKLYSRLLRLFFKIHRNKVPIYHINKGKKEKKKLTRIASKDKRQLRTSISRYEDVFIEAGFNVKVGDHLIKIKRDIPSKLVFNDNCIGISPFAKHAGKILPLQTVRGFIELMQKNNPKTTIYIYGGGLKEKMAADSLVAWYSNCVSLISTLSLKEEMDIMANLKCMVSMDSSAMHMCSLVGTNVVSIWGATHHYAGFLGLNQNEDEIVGLDLNCRPCSVYGLKPCYKTGDHRYKCLNLITPKDIYDKVSKYL